MRTSSDRALPFRRARHIEIGGADVLAQRITYVGELGYELYVTWPWAVQVWDRLMAAGAEHGITPGGYRALESLRLEKGYRYFGTDLTVVGHALRERPRLLRGARQGGIQRSGGAQPGRGARRPARRLRTLTDRR